MIPLKAKLLRMLFIYSARQVVSVSILSSISLRFWMRRELGTAMCRLIMLEIYK